MGHGTGPCPRVGEPPSWSSELLSGHGLWLVLSPATQHRAESHRVLHCRVWSMKSLLCQKAICFPINQKWRKKSLIFCPLLVLKFSKPDDIKERGWTLNLSADRAEVYISFECCISQLWIVPDIRTSLKSVSIFVPRLFLVFS